VFFPIPAFDDTFAAKFLSKNFKFLYVAAVPIMVLGTGVKGSLLNTIFSFSMTSYLGRATYSIYLWQGLFTGAPFSSLHPATQVLSIILLVCFCVVLFEKVERPLIKIGRRISDNLCSTGALPALAPRMPVA
jgi:peptidoglycan/LPS O-acetylase OafA/YrhL